MSEANHTPGELESELEIDIAKRRIERFLDIKMIEELCHITY